MFLTSREKFVLLAALVALGGLGVTVALYRFLPPGYDFFYWYWPIPRAWLAGETSLYDSASRQFFSPPWTVWLLLPFASLDVRWGMTALTLVSLLIVGVVATNVAHREGAARPAFITLAVVLCPYSLTALFVGTLDSWALLGIYLGYEALPRRQPWLLGIALLLMTVRPQQCWLPLPLLLLGMRGWPHTLVLKSLALPGGVFLASLAVFGLDWPLRLVQSYTLLPPHPYLVTSTYAVARLAGIPVVLLAAGAVTLAAVVMYRLGRQEITLQSLGLAMTTNGVVAPYMLSHSYVTLLAIPWARYAARHPRLALLPYAISLPMLFRPLGLWDRLGLLDVTFPLVLLVLLLLESRFQNAGSASPASRVVA